VLLVPDVGSGRRRVEEVKALIRRGCGHVHLLGIGGFGMAGLAVHLRARGMTVSGCELTPGRISEWVAARNIPVATGHNPAHLASGVDWLVRSTAVADDNTEVCEARERGIPVFHRGFVLPALLEGRTSIAVSGTHGKTTTSAMIAHILASAGLEPGYCIGGEVDSLGGVAVPGAGSILVAEADESDGTVTLYEPDIAVITNIEYDHMEHFETEETLFRCFDVFARSARKRLVYCADDFRAARIGSQVPGAVSYGFSDGADVRGTPVETAAGSSRFRVDIKERESVELCLPVGGEHNALNALGACAVAIEHGVEPGRVAVACATFRPVRRRYETITERDGIVVISDYAHHPTEIKALVATALRQPRKRLRVVFQPHRFSRTKALGPDFPSAFQGVDEVVLVPVYAASESPLPGGTSDDLLALFKEYGNTSVRLLASLDAAWEYLRATLLPGDLLLIVGAGDVEHLAYRAKDFPGVLTLS
jgi:UDP-N-acetylmuramate--alanine ligase